jgi:hypothetical protein
VNVYQMRCQETHGEGERHTEVEGDGVYNRF